MEQQQKQALLRDRIRFIRLLKAGLVKSQRLAGEQIGLKERQSQRLWHSYRTKGIQGLLSYPYQGTFGKLSTTQVSRLTMDLLPLTGGKKIGRFNYLLNLTL